MKELRSSYRDALIIKNHPQVYIPQEDTLMLANNPKVEWNSKVLEIGVGSGYISLLAAEKAEKVIGIDINPHAIRLAKLNAELNGIEHVEIILGDLFSPISNNFNIMRGCACKRTTMPERCARE